MACACTQRQGAADSDVGVGIAGLVGVVAEDGPGTDAVAASNTWVGETVDPGKTDGVGDGCATAA